MNRARLIKFIKTGQRFMGWGDDVYRAWLEKNTGRRSCTECNDGQLALLADILRKHGFAPLPAPRAKGGSGPGFPSQAQWRKVEMLAKEHGYRGLDDPGFATLCHKVAKVDSPRFLDAKGVNAILAALENWLAHKKNHLATVGPGTAHGKPKR